VASCLSYLTTTNLKVLRRPITPLPGERVKQLFLISHVSAGNRAQRHGHVIPAIYGLIAPLLEDVNITQCSIYFEWKGKVIKRLLFTQH
jgi:hypothetical protein